MVNNPDKLKSEPEEPTPGTIVQGKKKVILLDGETPQPEKGLDKNIIVLPAAVP
jgi:hypothetical protein